MFQRSVNISYEPSPFRFWAKSIDKICKNFPRSSQSRGSGMAEFEQKSPVLWGHKGEVEDAGHGEPPKDLELGG